MKVKLLRALTAGILFLMPNVIFGQAPTTGTAANFVLFSTVGAVTNSGIPHLTHLTGNVGSNSGSSTGFGNVDGQMHDGDGASIAAASDLLLLYSQLDAATPTAAHSTALGGGETMVAGVYDIPAATTINGELILNALGDPNALFIFQIGGALSTGAFTKVKLINGALACNVFWSVEGLVSMATGTSMKGTIVAHNFAINMNVDDTLEGRALAINGAVTTNAVLAYMPIGCGSAVLTGPAAPALGAAASFGVFSNIGAVTSTPVTYVIGDVGSNSTATTGFDPGNVTGTIYAPPHAVTAAAASDLTLAYNYLTALSTDINLLDPANFGYDLVLTPHTYNLAGAPTVLTGSIYLNAQGNPNAVFVIKMSGALSTSAPINIKLINGAQAKNVYWMIAGAANIFSNSVFNGTIVGGGAINLNTNDTLNGRALTINGAIAINGSYVTTTPAPCTASSITGTNLVCEGATTTLANSDTGGTWSSSNIMTATVGSSTGVVTGIAPGTVIITYVSGLACQATDTVTVNALPPTISGAGTVCTGAATTLTDGVSGGSWSSSNTSVATIGSTTGVVSGLASGTSLISYVLSSGCATTKAITVNPMPVAGTITGSGSVCPSGTSTLSNTTSGGVWSSVNTAVATIGSASGVVSGVALGTSTISYTVTNGCGSAAATLIVTVSATPNAGTVTGSGTVCPSGTTTLANAISGGTWTSVNTSVATIGSATGIVTGVVAGTTTISYTVTNSCGTAAATMVMTVNSLPNAGSITGIASVCPSGTSTLSDAAGSGVWTSVNTSVATIGSASGIVSGVALGTSTISYTVTNGCGTAAATVVATVTGTPVVGAITGTATVCPAATTTLSNATSGGVWSSVTMTTAVIGSATGVVTGLTPGTTTISYTVSTSCGTAAATTVVTVNVSTDAGTIAGPTNVCPGATISLTDGVTGGTWNSSNSNATVSTSGVVSGVTTGNVTISYTVSGICGTATATHAVTVNPLPNAGSITGLSAVCIGSAITLSDAVTGGTWTSTSATATVVSGVVSGISVGTATIQYAVTNACGTATVTKNVTVNPLPAASAISTHAPSTVCAGTMYQNFGTSTALVTGTTNSWTAVNATVWAQGTAHQYALISFNTPGIATVNLVTTIPATGCASKSTMAITVGTSTAQTDIVSRFINHFVCTPNNENSYQWGYDDKATLDSTILTGEINQDYVNASPDLTNKAYWVMTSLGGCTQKTYYRAPTTVANVNDESASMSLYPNPATDLLNVDIMTNITGSINVAVWNIMGQKMLTAVLTDNKAALNVALLPAGTYIVNCYADGVTIATTRFIKN